MSKYVISCCSTVDISKEHLERRDLPYVCFHYTLGDRELIDDLGVTISLKEFYATMEQDVPTKTSQVSVGEYKEHFEKYLSQGLDLIHVCLSSGISGTINSANIAADDLREEYPDRTIYIVDSLAASAGYGLLMDTMADLRDQGLSLDELYRWTEENKLRVNHWFFSTTLKYFIRGGRVSKSAGFIGNLLNICPLLNVDWKGRLIPRDKFRGKKKVYQGILKEMTALADHGTDYDGKCYISHSACYEDARAVADLIEATFPNLSGKVEINDIGTTIGSHTGPGTVALFFMGQKRPEEPESK